MKTKQQREHELQSWALNRGRQDHLGHLMEHGHLDDLAPRARDHQNTRWYRVSRHMGGANSAYAVASQLRTKWPHLRFKVVVTTPNTEQQWSAEIWARKVDYYGNQS